MPSNMGERQPTRRESRSCTTLSCGVAGKAWRLPSSMPPDGKTRISLPPRSRLSTPKGIWRSLRWPALDCFPSRVLQCIRRWLRYSARRTNDSASHPRVEHVDNFTDPVDNMQWDQPVADGELVEGRPTTAPPDPDGTLATETPRRHRSPGLAEGVLGATGGTAHKFLRRSTLNTIWTGMQRRCPGYFSGNIRGS